MDIPLDATVEATDGHVGTVARLVTDPEHGQTTHLVLQEGHLLGKREITLPLSAIDRVEGETVHLKLDKHAIHSLPAIPVHAGADQTDITQIELLARVFDDPEGAARAMDSLKDWDRHNLIEIRTAAVLVKDENGETSVKASRGLDPAKGGLLGAFGGAVIGLLAGPPGMIAGALAGAGAGGLAGAWVDKSFSKDFLERFQQHLQPGTSALVMIVEHDSVQQLSEALSDLPGIVLQQTITDTVVEELLEAMPAEE